jgi:hypothetical protein|eukprot:COSAG01_NODE_45498_length_409_cov_0.451613_1_plen_51_part_10
MQGTAPDLPTTTVTATYSPSSAARLYSTYATGERRLEEGQEELRRQRQQGH